jgi:hypothetical protein
MPTRLHVGPIVRLGVNPFTIPLPYVEAVYRALEIINIPIRSHEQFYSLPNSYYLRSIRSDHLSSRNVR